MTDITEDHKAIYLAPPCHRGGEEGSRLWAPDDPWGDDCGCPTGNHAAVKFIHADLAATALAEARQRALDDLYRELNTLKWIGSDEGWELAIAAVRRHITGSLASSKEKS